MENGMAKAYNQKMKLLHLLRILNEKTDENHYLTAAELIEELDKEGISAERKSIYSDIEELIIYGYDIIHVKSRTNGGYYMGSSRFCYRCYDSDKPEYPDCYEWGSEEGYR